MVHVKRAVGYVQIALGIMLLFACFVAYDLLSTQLSDQYGNVIHIYRDNIKNLNLSLSPKEVLDNYQFVSISAINAGFTIQALVLVVFLLAVMMVLQGVANTRTGSDGDIPTQELGKFVISLFLILYVIAAAYILFFKAAPSERLFAGLSLLIVLAAFVGIILLVNNLLKRTGKKKD
jgi:uncharacterized membrane protein